MGTEYESHTSISVAMYGPSSRDYHAEFSSNTILLGGKQNTDATQRLYDALLSEGVEAGNVTSGFTRDGCTASVMYCHINYKQAHYHYWP
jgi:hypothetical protein